MNPDDEILAAFKSGEISRSVFKSLMAGDPAMRLERLNLARNFARERIERQIKRAKKKRRSVPEKSIKKKINTRSGTSKTDVFDEIANLEHQIWDIESIEPKDEIELSRMRVWEAILQLVIEHAKPLGQSPNEQIRSLACVTVVLAEGLADLVVESNKSKRKK